ncbi:MAG TPA: heme-binding protein [Propylenella sp.]
MRDLNLAAAQTIVSEALRYSREHGFAPMTVVVLDDRGTVKAAGSEDGSSLSRFDIARGKAFGCLAFDLGIRAVASKAQPFVNAVGQLHGVSLVPVPGGVLLRTADAAIAGAVGISGDTSEHDEEAAVAGVRAAGLIPDTGA